MDVVTLGESMVTFVPTRPGRLADVPSFDRAIGGAESNVACVLASAGHTVRWVSRVGADGFGDHLVSEIGSYGVDTGHVVRDPARPTGVYFRTAGDRADGTHEVAYYRTGSAASAMSPATVDLRAVRAARILHLTGITAALSPECRALLTDLTSPAPGRPLISFDINYRPALWPTPSDTGLLLTLARRADIVFIGEDEAEQLWGVTGGPAEIRSLLPEPPLLVVKQGARGATAYAAAPRHRSAGSRASPSALIAWGDPQAARVGADGTSPAPSRAAHPRPTPTESTVPSGATHPRPTAAPLTVQAPEVSVVAAPGAGDAFAAGVLSGTLRDLPLPTRLRLGHLYAAAALTTPGDLAAPPTRDHADRLTALDTPAWERLRLGPGWTQADHPAPRPAAPEEARTP
ncbi:PfkB family carbohydrate kinase [Streptomyces sp. NPDC047028]|uniref:PfkB family carbohydrate kinase n=1 Tax=Streptomyces sp. NPDC047028 TaxID=3155793 RepID=UPI0033ED15FC